MLKIALVCQHGASTGICVEKMKQAAAKDNIECTIAAYPDSEMGTLVQLADCILLGPQIGFKKKIRLLKNIRRQQNGSWLFRQWILE